VSYCRANSMLLREGSRRQLLKLSIDSPVCVLYGMQMHLTAYCAGSLLARTTARCRTGEDVAKLPSMCCA
jgi:hypothetical protein